MGKGDRKTLKGKRYNASYGNSRSKGVVKATGTATAPVVKKAATKTVAKAKRRAFSAVGVISFATCAPSENDPATKAEKQSIARCPCAAAPIRDM